MVAHTEDLSPRGLYVRTDQLLAANETVDLLVTLPDGNILSLMGRVAHVLAPAAARAVGRHPGMGFELVGPDTPAQLKLRTFVDGLKLEVTNPGLVGTVQVIVVEPGHPLRQRMSRALEAGGFKITQCASAMEALAACNVWRPDAIVAAATMDGMTGVDLAYAMSEHATLSDVPLVLNGEDTDMSRLEAFRAGVRDFIPRPFLDEELLIRVHRIAAPVVTAAPGLRGSLRDIGLGTLLSLFEFERKSGILVITHATDVVRMFFAEGRLVKVESATVSGTPKDRLMRVLDWIDGIFEFSPAAIGGKDEVNLAVTALLLEHARIRDEQNDAIDMSSVAEVMMSSAQIPIPPERPSSPPPIPKKPIATKR